MKKHAFQLTALLLCLALVFSLGACGGDTEADSTAPSANESINAPAESAQPAGESETQPAESGTQAVQSSEPSEAIDQNEGTTAAKPDGGQATQPTKAPQDSQPKTVADIVAYYNRAANKIKTDKPGFHKVNVKNKFPGSTASLGIIPITPFLDVILGEETTDVKKGQSSNDVFPAAGFSWSSKLDPKYVKSATCTKSGSSYNIHITLKDETNPQVGKGGYGSCMSVIDKAGAQEMMGTMLTIESITMQYHDGYIKATVDIATGRITYAELYAASKMENVKTNLATANLDIESKDTFTNFQW